MIILFQLIFSYTSYLWNCFIKSQISEDLKDLFETNDNTEVFDNYTNKFVSTHRFKQSSIFDFDVCNSIQDNLKNELDKSTDNIFKFSNDDISYGHAYYDSEKIKFYPPVYIQRYVTVQHILKDERWRGELQKVVDFGCAELQFFKYIKEISGIIEILLVDIDDKILRDNRHRIQPWFCEPLHFRREMPLTVKVLNGSVSVPDRHLKGVDAVVAIELVEHMYPDELDMLPLNIFGYVKPRLAIFTTPNSDFNVLFENFSGFRHPDHKFEWSREQFENWAENICLRFPEYTVGFLGIGRGPKGEEMYGHCSQAAIFQRTLPRVIKDEPVLDVENYSQIESIDFPMLSPEPPEQQTLEDASTFIHSSFNIGTYYTGTRTEIPLSAILMRVYKTCKTSKELRRILEESRFKMEVNQDNEEVVVLEEDEDDNAECDRFSNDSTDDFDPAAASEGVAQQLAEKEWYDEEWWESSKQQPGPAWDTGDRAGEVRVGLDGSVVETVANENPEDIKEYLESLVPINLYETGDPEEGSSAALDFSNNLNVLLSRKTVLETIESVSDLELSSEKSSLAENNSDSINTVIIGMSTEQCPVLIDQSDTRVEEVDSLGTEDGIPYDAASNDYNCRIGDENSIEEAPYGNGDFKNGLEFDVDIVGTSFSDIISLGCDSAVGAVNSGTVSNSPNSVQYTLSSLQLSASPSEVVNCVSSEGVSSEIKLCGNKEKTSSSWTSIDTSSKGCLFENDSSKESVKDANSNVSTKVDADVLADDDKLQSSIYLTGCDIGSTKSEIDDVTAHSIRVKHETEQEVNECCTFDLPNSCNESSLNDQSIKDEVKDVAINRTCETKAHESESYAAESHSNKSVAGLAATNSETFCYSKKSFETRDEASAKSENETKDETATEGKPLKKRSFDMPGDFTRNFSSDSFLCGKQSDEVILCTHSYSQTCNLELKRETSAISSCSINKESNSQNLDLDKSNPCCSQDAKVMYKSFSSEHLNQKCSRLFVKDEDTLNVVMTTSLSGPASESKPNELMAASKNCNCCDNKMRPALFGCGENKDCICVDGEGCLDVDMLAERKREDSCSPDKFGPDSGYPNSSSGLDMEMDTPEQVKEIMTESESSLENSPPESPVAVPHPPIIPVGDNVENGDVANNNRDGEGNNMIGPEFIGEPREFHAVIEEQDEGLPLMDGARCSPAGSNGPGCAGNCCDCLYFDGNEEISSADLGEHSGCSTTEKALEVIEDCLKKLPNETQTAQTCNLGCGIGRSHSDIVDAVDDDNNEALLRTASGPGSYETEGSQSIMCYEVNKSADRITDVSDKAGEKTVSVSMSSRSSDYENNASKTSMEIINSSSSEMKDLSVGTYSKCKRVLSSEIAERTVSQSFLSENSWGQQSSSTFNRSDVSSCCMSLSSDDSSEINNADNLSNSAASEQPVGDSEEIILVDDVPVPLTLFDHVLISLIREIAEDLLAPIDPFPDWLSDIQLEAMLEQEEIILGDGDEDAIESIEAFERAINSNIDVVSDWNEQEQVVEADIKGGGDSAVGPN